MLTTDERKLLENVIEAFRMLNRNTVQITGPGVPLARLLRECPCAGTGSRGRRVVPE